MASERLTRCVLHFSLIVTMLVLGASADYFIVEKYIDETDKNKPENSEDSENSWKTLAYWFTFSCNAAVVTFQYVGAIILLFAACCQSRCLMIAHIAILCFCCAFALGTIACFPLGEPVLILIEALLISVNFSTVSYAIYWHLPQVTITNHKF